MPSLYAVADRCRHRPRGRRSRRSSPASRSRCGATSSTTSTGSRSRDDGPVGGPEAIFDRMSIEIARGCTEGCRFCQAGMIYRPVRERDPEQIVDTVVERREEERLRRGEPHVALDRRLLVHRAAHREGDRARSRRRRSRSASRRSAPTASRRPSSTTSAASARAASRSRPRPAASACATS